MDLDLKAVGKRFKEIYGVNGVAKDGRKYSQIPDEEIAALYIQKHGADKAFATLGLGDPNAQAEATKSAASLRKEYNNLQETKSYKEIRKQYDNMQTADDTAAGDLSIIYSYVKMLDPTTAVREGEIQLGDKAESLPSRIKKVVQKVNRGGALSPQLRREYISEGASIYNNVAKTQKEVASQYAGYANDMRLNPSDVVGNVEDIKIADIPEFKQEKKKGLFGGGLLGGVLGGLGGLMVGGPVGAGVGGAIGAGAGGATQNMIMDLLGKQTQEPGEQLKQVGGQALNTGLTASAIGGLLPGVLRMGGKAIGIKTAGEVAKQTAGGGVKGAVVSAGKKIESLNPATYMRGKQLESAKKLSNVKIDPADIKKSVDPLIKKIPSLKKTYDEYSGVVNSVKNPTSALEALDIFKSAYTQAGRVKAGLEPQLLKTLYEATLKKLPEEVAQYRTLTKYAIEAPKAAGKALWRAALSRFTLGG